MQLVATKPPQETRADEALDRWALGPGSVTWKVARDPTIFLLGQVRTGMLLMMHPPFAASAEHDTFTINPLLRFRRVAIYAYTATYGTCADAERVSHMVRTRHDQVRGVEPLTQRPYQSNAEYELALTHVIQSSSYLAVYEALNGQLSAAERDQFYLEQKVPSALLGIHPDHLPSTYGETETFLAQARQRFAAGARAREILHVHDRGRFPAGTALGDLPAAKRRIAELSMKVFADIAISTLCDEDRAIVSINRRPKLVFKAMVRLSLRLFSVFMRSKRGEAFWTDFLQKKSAAIFTRALRAADQPGHEQRAKNFCVPDAHAFYRELSDLKRNWPGSVDRYALGRDVEGPISTTKTIPIDLQHLREHAAAMAV